MKRAIILVAVLAGAIAARAADKGASNRAEQPFSNNGHIRMELGGGDYEIRPGAADKIVVTYNTERPEQMKDVEVKFVGGRDSTKLKVHGPHNNFKAVIEVPPVSDLHVRLLAGDLRLLEGVQGNKDVESHAGDLTINVGNAQDYGSVDASVRAGDLNAPAFRVSKGGLFRSFSQQGPGKYRLHAHLGAGDLVLK